MKKRIAIFLLVSVISSTTLAIELSCRFKTKTDWWAIDNIYFCELRSDVENFDDMITAVNGFHLDDKSNADVAGFRSNNRQLKYFPNGLDKYFNAEKIEFIAVWESELKEIHQSDLAPFTKLRVLSLWANDFEVIESDLLKFNPLIEYIGLGKNKIKLVNGDIFGHLKALHTLHIDDNQCISRQVAGNRAGVLHLLQEIKYKCSGSNDVAGGDFELDVRTVI